MGGGGEAGDAHGCRDEDPGGRVRFLGSGTASRFARAAAEPRRSLWQKCLLCE
eukprot:NODE_6023_length_535_cov_192.233333.p5 GENE.NODE_6023_length_535_cov_192.233333~~NODE_6023_length_535_cov_192.233333.p5  ORF type:complete len:53 (+),score=2.85 NODE_6023_length_535_cov_192.233333:3-161(+)